MIDDILNSSKQLSKIILHPRKQEAIEFTDQENQDKVKDLMTEIRSNAKFCMHIFQTNHYLKLSQLKMLQIKNSEKQISSDFNQTIKDMTDLFESTLLARQISLNIDTRRMLESEQSLICLDWSMYEQLLVASIGAIDQVSQPSDHIDIIMYVEQSSMINFEEAAYKLITVVNNNTVTLTNGQVQFLYQNNARTINLNKMRTLTQIMDGSFRMKSSKDSGFQILFSVCLNQQEALPPVSKVTYTNTNSSQKRSTVNVQNYQQTVKDGLQMIHNTFADKQNFQLSNYDSEKENAKLFAKKNPDTNVCKTRSLEIDPDEQLFNCNSTSQGRRNMTKSLEDKKLSSSIIQTRRPRKLQSVIISSGCNDCLQPAGREIPSSSLKEPGNSLAGEDHHTHQPQSSFFVQDDQLFDKQSLVIKQGSSKEQVVSPLDKDKDAGEDKSKKSLLLVDPKGECICKEYVIIVEETCESVIQSYRSLPPNESSEQQHVKKENQEHQSLQTHRLVDILQPF